MWLPVCFNPPNCPRPASVVDGLASRIVSIIMLPGALHHHSSFQTLLALCFDSIAWFRPTDVAAALELNQSSRPDASSWLRHARARKRNGHHHHHAQAIMIPLLSYCDRARESAITTASTPWAAHLQIMMAVPASSCQHACYK
jgi:hypothetical protein